MAADVRYRCCKHCLTGPGCPDGHLLACPCPGCPGRMPIDPETED